jgi:hypothetical protein
MKLTPESPRRFTPKMEPFLPPCYPHQPRRNRRKRMGVMGVRILPPCGGRGGVSVWFHDSYRLNVGVMGVMGVVFKIF